jgi:3-hydroxyacyl-CoA dehydrogenase
MANLQRIGIVGAGVMGAGIAQVLATAGCDVYLTDRSGAALATALNRVAAGRFGLEAAVDRQSITQAEAASCLSRIHAVQRLPRELDLAIEAVPEDLTLKIEVLRELDETLSAATIFASTTSGLSLAALASVTKRPESVIVWHFASPAPVMPLAEIVVTTQTSHHVTEAIVGLAQHVGKNPIVIRDQPLAWGFVTNRIFASVTREAAKIVAEGVATPEEVDQLLKDCFRWPTGPFEMFTQTTHDWEDQSAAAELLDADPRTRLARFLFPYTAGSREG